MKLQEVIHKMRSTGMEFDQIAWLLERARVREVLSESDGHMKISAGKLNISPDTLKRMVTRYRINRHKFKKATWERKAA